jgi:hypothetical protein
VSLLDLLVNMTLAMYVQNEKVLVQLVRLQPLTVYHVPQTHSYTCTDQGECQAARVFTRLHPMEYHVRKLVNLLFRLYLFSSGLFP